MASEEPPEHQENLWLLIAGPGIWATHFMLCYVTAAIWCAKVAAPVETVGTLGGVRIAVAIYTLVALTAIGFSIFDALRRYRMGRELLRHEYAAASDRHRFLGLATLLLSGLSFIATVFVAMTAYFFGNCQ